MKKNESLAQYFLDKKSQIIKFFILVILFFSTAIVINQNYKKKPFIAKIYLEGMITSESNLVEKIDQLKQKQNLKGILLTINSPGGTFVSSKEIYDTLKFFDEKIPVAIYMKEVATSGAYLVSLGADQIFANTGTITGSVGVILQTADISLLLNKIGVSPLVIKSGDLKAIPNPLEKTNDEQIKYIKNVVLLMQEEFSKIVKLERELTWDNLEKISDGRIFTGNQAKEINLIDEIGAENDAIDWIKKKAGLDDNIKIIDYAKEDSFFDFLNLKFLKKFNDMNVKLNDGILAIWTP